jgi:AraC-like DNA-binding protein
VTTPLISNARLVNSTLTVQTAGNNSFCLAGQEWEAPTFENADDFVARLVRAKLLVADSIVLAALQGETIRSESPRTLQRRFVRSTGLSRQAIFVIERAHAATVMLRRGDSISDTVGALGFSDQSHLTRSLRRLIGRTPAQLASKNNIVQLSLIPWPEPRAFTTSTEG